MKINSRMQEKFIIIYANLNEIIKVNGYAHLIRKKKLKLKTKSKSNKN